MNVLCVRNTGLLRRHRSRTRPRLLVAGLAGSICMFFLYYYASRIEPGWIEARELELRLPDLPAGLEGLRIAQISDLHITGAKSTKTIRKAFRLLSESRPDLIAVTGDLINHTSESQEAACVFRSVACDTPVFVVFGNHDYEDGPAGVERLARLLRQNGVTPLRNETIPFERNGSTLWITGLDDPCTGRADLSNALAGLEPGARPRLLLTHSAEEVERVETGAFDLALSGHTHGGQIFVPFATSTLLRREFGGYSHGVYRVNDVPVYINRGLGSLAIQARFLRRPEVTLITLRSGAGLPSLVPIKPAK